MPSGLPEHIALHPVNGRGAYGLALLQGYLWGRVAIDQWNAAFKNAFVVDAALQYRGNDPMIHEAAENGMVVDCAGFVALLKPLEPDAYAELMLVTQPPSVRSRAAVPAAPSQ